ncbi:MULTISPECIES: MurR/RpiR family transcriptional regulator [Phyllobacteriaceae]|uniref:MurR/RpiR family transcriptional regulator n=1 Tax=Phyllobacteriaceae TaxID=69277 RepID=UPI002ACA593A|nr:MurR/RpiR family transcriptional regulator [Chelativorans sp. M5D2P16]MDZ5696016.1 MurR/RpiR family transcriptional regulator [Chelativorans sp. M5D2P16]
MNINDPQLLTNRNILEVVRTVRPDLRKSDRKVADALLSDPHRILNATVAETAQIAEVSQPTVIRFCTAIGCEGFQDLKIRLAQSLALGTPATHSAITDEDSPEEVASKIFDYTITSLDWARKALDMTQMNAAVDLILEANHLEFFGFGASAIVAQDLQQKFPLFGIPCNATMDSHQQLMAASMMKRGSVAVAISNTGGTLSIVELARLAREQGARVISITGSTQTALVDYSDVVINVETLDNTDLFTPTTSRIAALVAADILSTLVARRLGKPHNQRLVRMKRYLSQMRKNEAF